MKYFLDFDGVIFNVALLKKKMIDLGVDESKRSADVLTQLTHNDAAFDLSQLVFTDALTFLETHKDCCEIVSSFVSSNPNNNKQSEAVQQAYQEAKIVLSGVADIIGREHVHVVGTSKVDALSLLQQKYAQGEALVFIDDRLSHIEEAAQLGLTALWMRRHMHEEGAYVRSFEDLEKLLSTWKK